MRRVLLEHLTYANVMATVAVFLALGGAGYAAATLPRNSVGAAQLKKNAVTGVKVKRGSLSGSDLKDGSISSADIADASLTSADFRDLPQAAAGAQAAIGPAGPAGPAGDRGPAGRSALAPLAGGETIRGAVGQQVNALAGEEFFVVAALPIPAPEALTNSNVIVDGPYDDPTDRCRGSFATPTAPPGVLCIYGSVASVGVNSEDEEGTAVGGGTAGSPATPYGFALRFYATAAGEASVLATWAYTAP